MKPMRSRTSLVFLVLAIMLCVLLGACGYMYLKYRKVRNRAVQTESLIQKMRQEEARLAEEKSKLEKENQKLQSEAVSYLGINTRLQDDKDAVSKQLDEARKMLERKEGEVQRAKLELEELIKSTQEAKDMDKKNAHAPTLEGLKKKLAGLEDTLRRERALYYYNMGVAYAKAKLYKEAEASYEKSLEFEPANAEAHYNLGLMYDNYEYDSYRAKMHFAKYLELRPQALDKEEVEGWMRALSDRIE